jgi:hypothetical protein
MDGKLLGSNELIAICTCSGNEFRVLDEECKEPTRSVIIYKIIYLLPILVAKNRGLMAYLGPINPLKTTTNSLLAHSMIILHICSIFWILLHSV